MVLDDNHTDRETFKKQIFTQVFYGKNCYEGRLTKLFAKEFPTVWETIRTIKKEDYKRLSHQMLRLESEIVINRAVRQCALEGIWVVTIHDCLVTYPEQAERVRQIMVEAFESVGINRRSRSQRLIRMPRMPAEAILAPGWTDRASLYFDLTEKALGLSQQ